MIETVLWDENSEQLYVCYNDANCVNVYTETGNFLWRIATSYMRNPFLNCKRTGLLFMMVMCIFMILQPLSFNETR